jgi:ketopantoate reductase
MKIVMMGSGAMGGLFGGLLTRSGEEVWLVGNRKEQIDTIRSAGLTFEEKGEIQIIPMKATLDAASVGKAMIPKRLSRMLWSLKKKIRSFLPFRTAWATKR